MDNGVAECLQLRHFQEMTARACFNKDGDDLGAVRVSAGGGYPKRIPAGNIVPVLCYVL